MVNRSAQSQSARGGHIIFDQQYFEPEHTKHGFERYRPNLFMFAARITAVPAEQFASVPSRQPPKPIDL